MDAADPRSEPQAAPRRVVVLAPLGRDAIVIAAALDEAAITCKIATDITDFVAAVRQHPGAALLTEETLAPPGVAELTAALSQQPRWSDLPLLLLLGSGRRVAQSAKAIAALEVAGNLTVLVRPVPSVTLVTAVQAALRARRRQYEVRDLIDREQAARLVADDANRLKDEFLATVSHELRTPLSAILLWSQLLAGGRIEPEQTAEALQAITRSAQSQSRLIEDLLDVSRMISGKLRLNVRELNLSPIVDEAVAVVRPMADAKNVLLEATTNSAAGLVRADPDRVQQMIWNLLNNAIKFTPAGGCVRIELQPDDGQVLIRVTDTGQGIVVGFLPHVFERFRQDDAAIGRRRGGLGLGLSITQQLVELHGGSIRVESDGLGKGSIFSVRLPLA